MTTTPQRPLCAHEHPEPPSESCLARRRDELVALLESTGFSRDDAEDAAQDAVITGIRFVRSGDAAGLRNRRAWLRSVAVHAARTNARRRPAYAKVPESAMSFTPEDELARREEEEYQLAALFDAVRRLPEALRDTLVYCCLEGHTLKEASERFDVPVGTVNGRLIRARHLLRESLRSEGFDIPDAEK